MRECLVGSLSLLPPVFPTSIPSFLPPLVDLLSWTSTSVRLSLYPFYNPPSLSLMFSSSLPCSSQFILFHTLLFFIIIYSSINSSLLMLLRADTCFPLYFMVFFLMKASYSSPNSSIMHQPYPQSFVHLLTIIIIIVISSDLSIQACIYCPSRPSLFYICIFFLFPEILR